MIQNPAQLGRVEARIQHHQDRASHRHGEVRFERHHRVRRQHRHAIARLDPDTAQRRRQTMDPLVELAISVSFVPVDDRDFVGIDVCAARQEIERSECGLHILGKRDCTLH